MKPPIARMGKDKTRNGFAALRSCAIRKIGGSNAQPNENCTRYSYSYSLIFERLTDNQLQGDLETVPGTVFIRIVLLWCFAVALG